MNIWSSTRKGAGPRPGSPDGLEQPDHRTDRSSPQPRSPDGLEQPDDFVADPVVDGERFLSGVAQRLTTGFGGSKPRPGLEEEAGRLAGLLSEAGIPARGSHRGPRQARRRQPRARG